MFVTTNNELFIGFTLRMTVQDMALNGMNMSHFRARYELLPKLATSVVRDSNECAFTSLIDYLIQRAVMTIAECLPN